MSLEDAQRLAADENLQLVPSARQSKAGYTGVGFHGPHSCAVRASWTVGGVDTYLGSFSGVHEAALAVARHLGPEESARQAAKVAAQLAAHAEEATEAPEGMNLDEAWRIARQEGIELLTSTVNMCVDRQPNATTGQVQSACEAPGIASISAALTYADVGATFDSQVGIPQRQRSWWQQEQSESHRGRQRQEWQSHGHRCG